MSMICLINIIETNTALIDNIPLTSTIQNNFMKILIGTTNPIILSLLLEKLSSLASLALSSNNITKI